MRISCPFKLSKLLPLSLALGGPFLALGTAGTILDSFTITGTGVSGSGTITLMTTANPAVDEITNITGSFSTTTGGGFSGAITGLNPGSYSSTSPTTDAAVNTYDNLFYPSGSPPICGVFTTGSANVLDACGFDFLVTGGYEVNVYGSIGANGYEIADGTQNGSVQDDHSTPLTSFSVTQVPEPADGLLLVAGLFVLALIRFRKAKLPGLV